MFTYGSICSGIEAVSVAWRNLAMPLWFSEVDPFPCTLLSHHYPDIPNLGDMRQLSEKILNRDVPAPDVLVGGTPCQAFSVAGKRESLNDDRGNLTLALIHILEAIDYVRFENGQPPCVLVWENVPGVLNTKDNAFGHFISGLSSEYEPLKPAGKKWTNAGFVCSHKRNIAWRVLNAQYFGVAQRRKRVFLVASAGTVSPEKVLFEFYGGERHSETGGNVQKNAAAYLESGFAGFIPSNIGGTVRAKGGNNGGGSETLVVHGTQSPIVSENAHCLGRNNGQENVLFEIKGKEAVRISDEQDKTPFTVRKLTPKECERLQGFPDDYTKIPYRNKPAEQCPDGLRYKVLGNSMPVPVIRWIGHRLVRQLTARAERYKD